MNEARWVRILAFACGSGVLAFGAVGLVFADAGTYSTAVVFALGLVAWAVLLMLGRPVLTDAGGDEPMVKRTAIGAVVLAAAVGIWNAINAGNHVLMDRDPAIYNNAGRWIAGHGNLFVPRDVGALVGSGFYVSAPGLYDTPGHEMHFQGAHFLPALLAEARGIGGDFLMFRAPALLGAVALLAFFVVASRVLRHPLAALGAVAVLGLSMPQVFFSRDAYSELPTQVLLFTALWLFCDERILKRTGVLIIAGLSVGFIQAVRIDGLAIVAGLPPIFAVAWYRTPREERKRLALNAVACAVAVGIGVAVGVFDLRYRSFQYFADLRGDFNQLVKVAGASAVLSLIAIALEPVFRRTVRVQWAPRARTIVAIAGAVLVVLAGLLAWLVRPALNPIKADSSNPVFHARSVAWLGWYLGPLTLVLAIAGAALLVWALVMRLQWSTVVATALLAPEALLYLWRPSASPDQPWVTRRLLVAAFPAAVLLAFAALLVCARWIKAREPGTARTIGRVAIGIAAAVMVAYPVWTVAGVSQMSEQHGYLTGLNDLCDAIGKAGSLVVVREMSNQYVVTLPHPVRSWCGIPAARFLNSPQQDTPDPELLRAIAERSKATGRTLYIGAEKPETLEKWFPGITTKPGAHVVNEHQLAAPRSHRPDSYRTQDFTFVVAPVPTS
jgi:hypothetical protein